MRVLVPVDGSKYSMEALKVATECAKIKDAQIYVINVVPFIGGIDDHEISPARRERHMENLEKHADEIVRQASAALAAEKVVPAYSRMIVTSLSVPDAIVDFADKEKIDLIVIGSKGLSTSSRFKVGSVATHVVKYSPCSVYLVKIPSE